MDWKFILGGVFTIVCALIAAAFKEPKAYDELIKPALKWLSIGCFLIGIGALIGHLFAANVLLAFVASPQIEAAKKAADSSRYEVYLGEIAGLSFMLLDVLLYVIAEKAAKLKAKE